MWNVVSYDFLITEWCKVLILSIGNSIIANTSFYVKQVKYRLKLSPPRHSAVLSIKYSGLAYN